MVCGGREEKEERRVVVTLFNSWRRRMGRSFDKVEGSWEGGNESGIWLVDVAEELGNGGTGGRFRTGVEGAWGVALGSAVCV